MKTRDVNVNKYLKLAFEALGRRVGKKPLLYLTLSSILTIILGVGLSQGKYEPLSPEFFVVKNGRFEEGRKIMSSLFPSNVSKDFNPARLPNLIDGTLIYVVPKSGGNMIDRAIFQDIERLDKIVHNVTIETEKRLLNFGSICAKVFGACFVNPIVAITPKFDDIITGKYRFKFPVELNLRKMEVLPFAVNLGGVTVDEEHYVKSFTALRLLYHADESRVDDLDHIRLWEKAVAERLREENFESIVVYTVAIARVADDIKEANGYMSPFKGAVFFGVVIFSSLCLLTNSWIRSKPWLGLAAGVSALLALVSAYGVMFYAGVADTDLTLLVAFVVLGTEIDDAFIMVASWRTTNPKDSVEDRVAKTYSEAAVSITISSLTSFVAYGVGIAAPIAIVNAICLQCSICILFTYFYQIMFFGPFVALDGYREKSQRNAFTFCEVSTDEGKSGKGGDQIGDVDASEDTVMKYMRDVVGGLLQFPLIKVLCLMLFVANVAVASFFITELRKGSDVFDVIREGSEIGQAAEIQRKLFPKYQHPINIIINKTLNYWDKDVQESIGSLLKSFEDHPLISEPDVTVSWLKFFLMFADNPLTKPILSFNTTDKEDFLKGLRRIFLRFKLTRQFIDDINFNENYTEITSTRYIVLASNLDNVDDEARLLKDLEKIVEKSKIPVTIFSTLFIQGEQAIIIGKITMQTIWITSLLMFAIFLVFVASFPHAVLVALCVTSSMVGTVGFMSAWGIRLDIVALIIVVTCLGFSINYSAHMSYTFTTSKADSPNEKMKESIYRVGLPVIQGSLSTVIAVLILAFQHIRVFVACFKIIFLTVMETSFHALFVLPVALSLYHSCKNCTTKKKGKRVEGVPSNCVVECHHL